MKCPSQGICKKIGFAEVLEWKLQVHIWQIFANSFQFNFLVRLYLLIEGLLVLKWGNCPNWSRDLDVLVCIWHYLPCMWQTSTLNKLYCLFFSCSFLFFFFGMCWMYGILKLPFWKLRQRRKSWSPGYSTIQGMLFKRLHVIVFKLSVQIAQCK